MSWVVMRTVLPERRTLPSNTAPTLSLRAIVAMSVFVPLKENAEVRAATCSSWISAMELSSSSASPSERYSCSLSPLMFTKGSTAIECGGGAKAAADRVQCFEIQKYTGAAEMITAAIASRNGFHRRDGGTRSPIPGAALETALNGDSSGDSRRLIRSTKAGGVP